MTSSCEIVEALEEAVNDVNEVATEDNKEASPPVELSWMGDTMTSSQYAQVVFNDIKDSYPLDLDLEVSYTLTSLVTPGHGDRVCLYKLPYLQPHEYVAYVWTRVNTDTCHMVKFPVSSLPKEEDFYQFQYLKGDNQVAGASVPFQLRKPGQSSAAVCGVTEEDGLLVVQTDQTSLQQKYSSLLDLSEKLTEELTKKNESFIVLEHRHQSLVENSQKCVELEQDLQTLIRDKLQLEQTLTQTTETLTRSESLLDTTTEKLNNVEANLEQKITTIAELEGKVAALETKCGGFNSDIGTLVQERDSLANMLDQEIKSREKLLKEKQDLMGKLENSTEMLAAATHSKEIAVAEIRAQIEQQDKLRKELAKLKEEMGHVEAELVVTKQQLARFTEKEEDSYVVTSVLSSLGEKLEAKERELKQKNEEISLLKQLENSKNEIEIHEKCLEDADTRASDLEKKNQDLIDRNAELADENLKLKKQNGELTARLETGAEHYRKLAAEKMRLEKNGDSNKTMELYVAKIDTLESKISQLTEELRQARQYQDTQLSEIRSAVTSSGGSVTSGVDDISLVGSDTSNMDSVRIQQAVTRSSQEPVVAMPPPTLFNPVTQGAPTLLNPVPQGVTTLPHPLQPENVGPTSTTQPSTDGARYLTLLNCPLCQVKLV